jgi:hypothetical protein
MNWSARVILQVNAGNVLEQRVRYINSVQEKKCKEMKYIDRLVITNEKLGGDPVHKKYQRSKINTKFQK